MRSRSAIAALVCGLLALPESYGQKIHKEFPLEREQELVVIVDVSFGTLIVEKGPRKMAAVVEYEESDRHGDHLMVSYDPGSRGKLRIKSKKSTSVFDEERHDSDRRIVVQCTDAVPVTLELELGAGRGELDLTGLRIQEFRISTGASDVKLWCRQPNPISADQVEIESGVSKFTAEDLGNLNFRRLKFSGGVGSYRLGFGGRLTQDGEAVIDVGLGAVIVDVPDDVAARLHYDDNWFSRFTLDGDFQHMKSGVYETSGFADARFRLDIRIDSGLGSVKIRRR